MITCRHCALQLGWDRLTNEWHAAGGDRVCEQAPTYEDYAHNLSDRFPRHEISGKPVPHPNDLPAIEHWLES